MYRILHDLEWAVLAQVSPNEIALDQKHPDQLPPAGRDPVKFRMGSWTENIFGWFSGDRLEMHDGKIIWREKLGVKLGLDPNDRNVFSVSLQRPNTTDDANMVRVVEMYHNEIKFLVPVVGMGVSAPGDTLKSANGIDWIVLDAGGQYIKYRNRVPFDYGTGEVVWVQ